MASAGQVRRVFFDVGGTILRAEPSVSEVYARAAADHGFDVDPARLHHRFHKAWRESQQRAAARAYECSDDILRAEWQQIVSDTFDGAVPEEAKAPLFADLYERFVSPAAWRIAPGTTSTLAHLRERGLRLGVLSNWDRRLGRTLTALGLAEFFDLQIVSHEIGREKPHSQIFTVAIERAAVEPARILLVGDSLEADIRPARHHGLRTLWLAPAEERSGGEALGPAATGFADLGTEDWDRILA